MRKTLSTTLACLLLGALPASAVIQGFFTTLAGSYVVPAGKVLVLQAVAPVYNDPSLNILQLTPAGGGSTLQLRISSAATNGLYRFPTALNLPAGTSLNSAGMGVFGLLVEPQDLYVGIKSSFADPAVAGKSFTTDLNLASAAKPAVRIQTSTDLAHWDYDSTISVQPTAIKTNLLVTAAVTQPDSFYRATVRRR
jgi:hypothetical protein